MCSKEFMEHCYKRWCLLPKEIRDKKIISYKKFCKLIKAGYCVADIYVMIIKGCFNNSETMPEPTNAGMTSRKSLGLEKNRKS